MQFAIFLDSKFRLDCKIKSWNLKYWDWIFVDPFQGQISKKMFLFCWFGIYPIKKQALWDEKSSLSETVFISQVIYWYRQEKLISVTVKNYLYWSKVKYSTSIAYSPVPNNSPPRLQSFGFYVRPSLSYLDPTNPSLINFPNFVLQIFQRLLKPIVLLAKLLAI